MQKFRARHPQERGDQAASQARKGAGNDKGHQTVGAYVQSGKGHPFRILADGLENHAERAATDHIEHHRGNGNNSQHYVVIDRRISQGEIKAEPEGTQGKPGKAITAVGHRAPLVSDGKDHHAKGQGEHGKVHLIEPDTEEADHQRQQCGRPHGNQQAGQ